MSTQRRSNRRRKPWQAPDHKLAVATICLMVFLVIAGGIGWVWGERPTNARALAGPHSTSVNK
jgi:hypothetical protein